MIDRMISVIFVTSIAVFLMAKITNSRIMPGSHSRPLLSNPAVIKMIVSPLKPVIFVSEKSMYNAMNSMIDKHAWIGQKHV